MEGWRGGWGSERWGTLQIGDFFRDWEGTGISVKQSWKMMEKGSTYKGQWIEMSRWEWIEGNSYVSNKKTEHIIVKPAALIILGTLDQFFYVIKGKHHTNFAPKLRGKIPRILNLESQTQTWHAITYLTWNLILGVQLSHPKNQKSTYLCNCFLNTYFLQGWPSLQLQMLNFDLVKLPERRAFWGHRSRFFTLE